MTGKECDFIVNLMKEIGGFCRIECSEFGYNTGNYRVYLWSINSKTGNNNLTTICEASECPDVKAAKRIARMAKGKATARDQAAFAMMAAEKNSGI